jgi:Myb-like DNA-binding domain
MSSQPDTTILWCLEQLATENINIGTLVDLITHVRDTRGDDIIEETLKVRLMLAGFVGTTEITAATLLDLQRLHTVLRQTDDEYLSEKKEDLSPPPELLTLIKTELVAQGWRNAVNVNRRELVLLIRDTFGQHPEADEQKRFDEIQKAISLPAYRAHIDRLLDGDAAVHALVRYASEAQSSLGPTLLQVVNEDINSGNYVPGQQMPEPAPPAPSPPRLPFASPPRQPMLPARRVSQPAAPLMNPVLQHAMDQLNRAGGDDPLQQMNAQAQIIYAAAALAGAAANGNAAAARAPSVTPSRLAFPQNNARPVPQALRRESNGGGELTPAPARRKNQKWTEEEVKRLIEACRKHGPGAWALIEADNRDIWGPVPGSDPVQYWRTQVDLKDKWRNLTCFSGERAYKNNQEALAVVEMWKQRWQNNAGSVAARRRVALEQSVGQGNNQNTGAQGAAVPETTAAAKGAAAKGKKKPKVKRTGPKQVEIIDEVPEEEVETTEEQDEEDAPAARPAKKAKPSKKTIGAAGKKKVVKKTAAQGQRQARKKS